MVVAVVKNPKKPTKNLAIGDEVLISNTRQRGWIIHLFTTHWYFTLKSSFFRFQVFVSCIFLGHTMINYVSIDRVVATHKAKPEVVPWVCCFFFFF